MTAPVVYAIMGGVIGVLGGLVGTWASIHHTNSPAERRFMVRCAVGIWLFIALMLAALWLLPGPWRWMVFIPYSFALPLGIRYGNRRQMAIRAAEGNAAGAGSLPGRP